MCKCLVWEEMLSLPLLFFWVAGEIGIHNGPCLESCNRFVQHLRTENPSLDEHPGSNPGLPTSKRRKI